MRSHSTSWLRWAARAGVVGPLLLALALVVLTAAQYDFLRSLRWHPLSAPTTDWPSGLALGPYGAWMTGAFIACGLLLIGFGLGLRQALRAGRAGALLLALAGVAMLGLSAPTDPTFGSGGPTFAGRLHDLSFVALGLTLWPALLVLAIGFRRDPRWASYSTFTWVVAALVGPAFVLKGLMFYGLLLAVILWFEVIAVRLGRLASDA